MGLEGQSCRLFNGLASNSEWLVSLKEQRRDVVFAVSAMRHTRLLKNVIDTLSVTAQDLNQEASERRPSLFWMATLTSNPDLLDLVLSTEGGLRDDAGPDGATGFAFALAKKDAGMIRSSCC